MSDSRNPHQRCGLSRSLRTGPVMVIYPEGVWYGPKNESDIDEILTMHLQRANASSVYCYQTNDVKIQFSPRLGGG